MAPVTWKFAATVPAPPDAVFAWMQEFREDDHSNERFLRGAGVTKPPRRPAKRTIVRREGNAVELDDEWNGRKNRMRVTIVPERREIRLEGGFGYSATWRAVPDGTGTSVETEGTMAPKGLFGLLLPLFAKGAKRDLEKDFAGHLADLRESLAR